jgi:hypothetical protein
VSVLGIDGSDLARLSDSDLRTLIGLLCEAELQRRHLPTTSATYGGHQDAPDGGLDVMVSVPPETPMQLPVPRAMTGYQVKAKLMGPAAIRKEMKPNGVLRAIISELAASGDEVLS